MRRILILLVAFGMIGVTVQSSGGFRSKDRTGSLDHRTWFPDPQLLSQHEGHAPGGTAFSSLPLAIDGAKTPELISDDIAYAHFLSVVAIKSVPSPVEAGRRKTILATVGLADQDSNALITSLTGVREQLADVDNQRKQLPRNGVATSQSLALSAAIRAQQETIMREARFRVNANLSSDGLQKLHEHVQRRVKPRIKVYGDPR
jgi:hypothetical protein